MYSKHKICYNSFGWGKALALAIYTDHIAISWNYQTTNYKGNNNLHKIHNSTDQIAKR